MDELKAEIGIEAIFNKNRRDLHLIEVNVLIFIAIKKKHD